MLFSPALLLEPQLLAMGLGIACALLLVIEAIRVTRVPWLGLHIHSFMTSFIDERDSGLLLVTPSPTPFPVISPPIHRPCRVVFQIFGEEPMELACCKYHTRHIT